jgi:hypothetical protein
MSICNPSRFIMCLLVTRLDPSRAYPYPFVLTLTYPDPDSYLSRCTTSLSALLVHGGIAVEPWWCHWVEAALRQHRRVDVLQGGSALLGRRWVEEPLHGNRDVVGLTIFLIFCEIANKKWPMPTILTHPDCFLGYPSWSVRILFVGVQCILGRIFLVLNCSNPDRPTACSVLIRDPSLPLIWRDLNRTVPDHSIFKSLFPLSRPSNIGGFGRTHKSA